MRLGFLLRWSARDLRRRWIQVAVIALIIAVGTGVYAGLGSTAAWRRQSNDASFAKLAMYDLRVRAAPGVDVPEGTMAARLASLPDPSIVTSSEERLVVPTQVDASTADRTILVPGRIVSVDVRNGGPSVNKLWVEAKHGRSLQPNDDGTPRVALERGFAKFYDLPGSGTIRVGASKVAYVGQALAPEYFFIVTEEGGFFAEANFAAVFAPLHTAQALAGKPGRVNDLVIKLRPGTDPARAGASVTKAFAGSGLGVTVMQTRDEDAYRLLYDDIKGDQKFWNVFAGLILLGAAFGAFNLATRMVESQRREIGIGMALGMRPRDLVLRPMLVGVEIAALGVAFGVGMGIAVDAALRPVFTGMLPMPVWHTDFQPTTFARGAVIGFALPVLATAWPVWRAVRVLPIDAITTAHRSSRGGLSPLLRKLPWPRSTFERMPIGNVLRTPRRTVLTALGIGAAVTALLSTLGMLDSFVETMSRNDHELIQSHPDRVSIALQNVYPVAAPNVAAIGRLPSIGAVQPVLRIGARLQAKHGPSIDALVDITDLHGAVWAPTQEKGHLAPDGHGIVIAREAAKDLGVSVGDTLVVEYPRPTATGGVELTETTVAVTAIHPSPLRSNAFIDRSQLSTLGYPDVANELYVLPSATHSPSDVQRAAFGLPGVASAQPMQAVSKVLRDSLDEFVGIFRVLEFFIFLLALLMAYNATSINAEERRREHATLFAFGLRVRRVVRMEIVEGLVVGVIGTIAGMVASLYVLHWMTTELVGDTMPELGLDATLSRSTIVTAVALGVVAVAVAPLLTIRKLQAMNIPNTLRVVE